MRVETTKSKFHKLMALVLCLCMTLGFVAPLIPPVQAAGATGTPTSGVKREADPSTMDTYQQMLDFSSNTRYAGRLWSDKTVFAYGYDNGDENWSSTSNALTLNPADDGVSDTTINLDADFLHVYSVLGSTIQLNTANQTPLDLVMVLDVSGSMGDAFSSSSKIYQSVAAMNSAIDTLMKMNPNNRVAVVLFASRPYTLMPLAHYSTKLTPGYGAVSGGMSNSGNRADDDRATAANHVLVGDGQYINISRSNWYYNPANDKYFSYTFNAVTPSGGVTTVYSASTGSRGGGGNGAGGTQYIGGNTNLDSGMWMGLNILAGQSESDTVITTKDGKKLSRLPFFVVLGDGDPQYMTRHNGYSGAGGNWWDVSNPSNNWTLNTASFSNQGVLLTTLMHAAYMKAAVINKYVANAQAGGAENLDQVDLGFYSIGISLGQSGHINGVADGTALLNPSQGFTSSSSSPTVRAIYNLWNQWKTTSTWVGTSNGNVCYFNTIPGSTPTLNNVTKQQVIDNINYTDRYFNSDNAGDISGIFEEILGEVTGNVFTPVGGTNDMGVGDSVTYVDPVGKYMDVKDVKNLALFGELYGITKTAVYDYQWNTAYLQAHPTADDALPEGWYLDGQSGATDAQRYSGSDAPGGSAEKAWAAGWVYRISYKNASAFVPTLENINRTDPDQITEKMRQTVYTFYRIAEDQADRNKLHMNPAYGSSVPSNVSYDPTGQKHLDTPGVYALSDLRIWVEDSGDYSDTTSGTLTDTNYDEALWVNIPVNMLPLRRVTINEDVEGNYTYETNMTPGRSDYSASFPLRVFYTVGVSDDVLEASNRINIAGAISPEYIKNNKVTTPAAEAARGIAQGNLEFFSNWYNPLNRYGDYVTTSTDYTYGDPVTSFSPSGDNRYYSFEKALPLYNTAYVWTPTSPTSDPNTTYTQGQGSWRRVELEEDYTGSDARTFDPTTFGGKLIAQDLEPTGDQNTPEARESSIWAALSGKGISTVHDGDIVLLKNHLLTNVKKPDVVDEDNPDPFASNAYYYLPIEYYELGAGGVATLTQYVIARQGSEFGSAYQAAGITNGDMLVWHDVSGKNPTDYPYLSYTETGDPSRGRDYIGRALDPATGWYQGVPKGQAPTDNNKPNADGQYGGGTWVVCAKPGGLRVGDLAQAIQSKGGDYATSKDGISFEEYYKNDRYASDPQAEALDWGFYANNTTRTANNYYLPTISHNSNAAAEDVIVNVYLGNNGRLYVPDTTLLVTKLIDNGEGVSVDDTAEFNFQLYLDEDDLTQGTDLTAVVVEYNAETKSWQRQFHYIDLQLDNQLFLQTQDGNKATVDADGCRVIVDPENAEGTSYIYAAECTGTTGVHHSAGEVYNGTVYYVYIGTNSTTVSGGSANSFRVYHNEELEDAEEVPDTDVTVEGEKGKAGTFKVANVGLVDVDSFSTGTTYSLSNCTKTLTDFEVLTIDPNATGTTDITIITPYLTDGAYWTKTVTLGQNANPDEFGGAAGTPLTETDLYDQIIPSTDRSDYFAGKDNKYIAEHTAEFTLKHGQALLFSGIPSNTVYRVTEKLTESQIKAGYTLKEVSHTQQVGSTSTYRPGAQQIPVYYKDGYTYGEYGPDNYPSQYKDNKTEKGLMWAVNATGTQDSAYLHYEPFHHTNAMVWEAYSTMDKDAKGDNHHQPVDVPDGSSTFWLWDEATGTSTNTGVNHDVADNPSCKPLSEGGCDEDIGGNQVRHYFFKDGELKDLHYQGEGSGYIRNIGRYITSPTVHFGVEGEKQDDQSKAMPQVTANTNYTGVWSVFGNTGTFEESANFVNTIKNDKTETQINGENVTPSASDPHTFPGVQVGNTITYQIKWANNTGSPARVVIIDPLDNGVDFVEASNGGNFYEKMEDANAALKTIYNNAASTPTLDYGHVVIWDLGEQEPLAEGSVTLTVKVNKDAKEYWDYDGDGVADAPTEPAPTPDYLVRNRATVRVADNSYTTNTVLNPVGEPDKTESQIEHVPERPEASGQTVTVPETDLKQDADKDNLYHGPTVYVGDKITYKITWQNYNTEDTAITITDKLDPNVKFVSASFNPADAKPYGGNPEVEGPNPVTTTATLEAGSTKTDATVTVGESTLPVITYDEGSRTVTWNLGMQHAHYEGTVTLVVEVLESAKDPQFVDNHASVQVGNDTTITRTLRNPVPDPHKTETEVDGTEVSEELGNLTKDATGDLYGPHTEVGKHITYEISYSNYDEEAQTVTITDKLDDGADFFSATANGLTLNVDDTAVANTNVSIQYDKTSRTVTYTLKNVAPGTEGSVELVIVVNSKAAQKGEVENTASVKVGNDYDIETETVHNPLGPDKVETDPGNGVLVQVGDPITYQITWQNYKEVPALLVVEDPLDPGVDFFSASFGDVKLEAGTNQTSGTVTVAGVKCTVAIAYDANKHVVTWTFTDCPGYAEGAVTLVVKANEKAFDSNTYKDVGDFEPGEDDEFEHGTDKDYEVFNRANVNVDNEGRQYTRVVENPLTDKQETQIEHGESVDNAPVMVRGKDEDGNLVSTGPVVYVGDVVTYEVTYKNTNAGEVDVEITDVLDPGVDFVSASFSGVTLNAGDPDGSASAWDEHGEITIKYDAATRTVTWTMKNRPVGEVGKATLKVRVNEKATEQGEIENQAEVTLDGQSALTPKVENPTPKVDKVEDTPGEGKLVKFGEEIDYSISWRNYKEDFADVIITDKLDPGVDFLSASFGDVELRASNDPLPTTANLSITLDSAIGREVEVEVTLTLPEGTTETGPFTLNCPDGSTKSVKAGEAITLTLKAGDKYTFEALPRGTYFEIKYNSQLIHAGSVNSDRIVTLTAVTVGGDSEGSGTSAAGNTPTEPSGNGTPASDPGASNGTGEDGPEDATEPTGNTAPTEDSDPTDGSEPTDGTEPTGTPAPEGANAPEAIRTAGVTRMSSARSTYGTYAASTNETNDTDPTDDAEDGTTPPETDPAETTPPAETDPSETTPPTETGPSETTPPTETDPDETTPPTETDPDETTPPTETDPDETTPSETDPTETTPSSEDEPEEFMLLAMDTPVPISTPKVTKKITVTSGDITIEYDPTTHTVTWILANRAALTEGVVGLRVQVNEDADYFWSYADPNRDVDKTATDFLVRNQAGVTVDHDPEVKTRIVENPTEPKTETHINSDEMSDGDYTIDDDGNMTYPAVNVGDRITYAIDWVNDAEDATGQPAPANITITDVLDAGVDFVQATFEGHTITLANPTFETGEGDEKISITYTEDPATGKRTVTWNLGVREALEAGQVTLTVRVTDRALVPSQVINQATVNVGHTPRVTNEVRNPLGDESTLTVTKTVSGNAADPEQEFNFRVTVIQKDGTPLAGTFGDMTFNSEGVAEFTLKHGESKSANNLPANVDYKVEELTADGWRTTVPANATGTIPGQTEVVVEFENTRNTGVLSIKKVVAGTTDAELLDQTFDFTLTLTLPDGTDLTDATAVKISGGTETSLPPFEGSGNVYVLTFQLKDGEKVEIKGLPGGTRYTVTEAEQDPFESVINNATGTVDFNTDVSVVVTNTPGPMKTEPVPGDGKIVGVGTHITYEISWVNDAVDDDGILKEATVTITDALDPGLDFVSASFGDVTLTGEGDATGTNVTITYNKETHTVTWTLAERAAGAYGTVALETVVNENATVDQKVENQAGVIVDNKPEVKTNIVENPLIAKTETEPGDGEQVEVGEQVTYEISWTVTDPTTQTVTVVDPLDIGGTFVRASYGGVTLNANNGNSNTTGSVGAGSTVTIHYDADSHTVTWTITNPPLETAEHVELTVEVNEKAYTTWTYQDDADAGTPGEGKDHELINRASVQLGNNGRVFTDTMKNPLPEKTEVDPGEGKPVTIGQEVHYQIDWNNPKFENATVTITDKLDPGVDFVSASFGDVTLSGEDPTSSGTDDVTITYDKGTHTVTWTLKNRAAGIGGVVDLYVKVNENAKKGWEYPDTPGTEDDYLIRNRADVALGNTTVQTEEVDNPLVEKTETDPGDGAPVEVGQLITYEIGWANAHDQAETVKVEDWLDAGVDFVSATYDSVTIDTAMTNNSATNVNLAYDAVAHKVTLTLTEFPSGQSGHLTLTVRVNENAITTWTYGSEAGGGSLGSDKDHQVINRAEVNIGGDHMITDQVENPVPEKTEAATPGEGNLVGVGDTIHYDITWKNTKDQPAKIVITDELDPGVDFISASYGTVTLSGEGPITVGNVTIDYNKATHTVTWTLDEQDANIGGTVGLDVKVNGNATAKWDYATGDGGDGEKDYKVMNQATVSVDNKHAQTEIVENPLIAKTETYPGDGEQVEVGEQVTYEISWTVTDPTTQTVTVVDPLDIGGTFVSASYGGVTLNANGNSNTATGTVTLNGVVSQVRIEYNADSHTVTWTITNPRKQTAEHVELTVEVNENAYTTWTYQGNTDAGATGEGEDHELINRASVQLGNHGKVFTDTMENPVPEKTEVDPGEGEQVTIGQTVHYQIDWNNSKLENATVTITDKLDPGVDFVSASFGSVELTKEGTASGTDVTITYNQATHTVTWTLTNRAAGDYGTVDLYVKVNENAKKDWTYPDNPGTDDDYLIRNQAEVTVGNYHVQTEEVDNPVVEKTETDPGDGALVGVGDPITYEIGWANAHDQVETVTVEDWLDAGVDFVSASYGNVKLEAKEDHSTTSINGTVTVGSAKCDVTIRYDAATHKVTWTIQNFPAGESGKATLTVRVNENAVKTWAYDGEAGSGSQGGDKDHEVINRAEVTIGNDHKVTDQVENPVPEKTEVDPGEGEQVTIGQTVHYQIDWNNSKLENATVTITDKLDLGVDFDSASYDGVELTEGESITEGDVTITYNKTTHTVTWTLANRAAGDYGTVDLYVKVNENAKKGWEYPNNPGTEDDYLIRNQADVTVGNTTVQTEEVDNPVVEKTEATPGDGVPVGVGNPITYEIGWANAHDQAEDVTVEDWLDAGVDFVSASYGDVELEAKEDHSSTSVNGTVTVGGAKCDVTITYEAATHKVTWTIQNFPAGESGKATLTVRVNDDAVKTWAYDGEAGSGSPGSDKDHEVINRAEVTIGNDHKVTDQVENPVPEKTEVDPGEGEQVTIGQTVHYQIDWNNSKLENATVTITDKLDLGVDFDSASYDGVELTEGESITEGDVTITYNKTTHTVTWTLANRAAGDYGTVDLYVKVNENAKKGWTYPDNPGTDDDYLIRNQAEVTVGNTTVQTEEVDNPVPEKTETDPGDGAPVGVGDPITYEIGWANAHDQAETVTVEDWLDAGVDFVSASYGNVELEAKEDQSSTSINGTVTVGGAECDVTIAYDASAHKVTWTIQDFPAGESGKATLTVRVNENAVKTWDYDGDTGSGSQSGDKDHQVINRAEVTVGEDHKVTDQVENPLPEKTEVDPGEGEQVTIGQTVHYQIDWNNPKIQNATVTIKDKLDPGVDFVSASYGELKLTEEGSITEGDVTITYDKATHTVTWTLKNRAAGDYGTVDLYVKVNENAKKGWTYPDNPGTDDDYLIRNQAEVTVGNTTVQTEEVDNPVPEKTETDPGDGAPVGVGDPITYEIGWANAHDQAETVTVEDWLDAGVDFVSASYGNVELEAKEDQSSTSINGTVTVGGAECDVTIAYDAATHKVTWTIQNFPAGESGKATLTVRVNEDAVKTWAYNGATDGGSQDSGKDHQVINRAEVTVGNDHKVTDQVENPVPEKTETDPGEGSLVGVGDAIHYDITWKNTKDQPAVIQITDKLDPGVDFVSANYGDLILEAGQTHVDGGNGVSISYNATDRMVTWTLGRQNADAEGTVGLDVKVNENAAAKWDYDNGAGDDGEKDYEVLNQATVSVDNESAQTEIVENPVPEKTETNPGDGAPVGVGDPITYEIGWKNGQDTAKEVKVEDWLDAGVDFVSASYGNVELKAKEDHSSTSINGTVTVGDAECAVTITYDASAHKVTWTIQHFPAGETGKVILTVRVNENAVKTWTYGDETGGGSQGDDKDHQVINRAEVTVGNDHKVTNQVENPVPEKTETDPGAGSHVAVGDVIHYDITWKNTKDQPAKIVITDKLDPGVDFVSASYGELNLTEEGSITEGDVTIAYDKATHTVTWTLDKQAPGAEGTVGLDVKVNENATAKWDYDNGEGDDGEKDYEVLNQAIVSVDNDSAQTEIVENPVPEKTETNPGEGEIVKTGDLVDYTIHWKNGHTEPANVVIRDKLDPGVDFVSASFDGVTLNAADGYEAKDEAKGITIVYDPQLHQVTWTLTARDGGDEGDVTLEVRVNRNAAKHWEYPDEPGEGEDDRILNQAGVTVGNDDEVLTEIIPNPLKPVGDLLVTKIVEGELGDKNKVFHFTVTLSDKSINGLYGDMDFHDGVAEFTLRHGESARAVGLPDGVAYEVTEQEADKDGYRTTYTGETGEIVADETAEADFVNRRDPLPPPPDETTTPTTTPTNPSTPGDTPKTGDAGSPAIYLVMMAVSLLALAAAYPMRKKRRF